MALIVETGAGLAGADAYCSVEFAVAYHTARGNTDFLAVPSVLEKERLLRNATDYMAQMYRARWKGCRVSRGQRLDWPRYGVDADGFCVSSTVVPIEVSEACAELALRAIDGPLADDVGAQVKSKTVGPISITYADGARQTKAYTAVDNALRPYLSHDGSMIAVVRA